MTQIIIYPNPLGKVVIVSPAPDADITDVAAAVVPENTPHRIIDADDLPPASDWLWSDEGPILAAPPAPIDPKLIGIEFDGIMCSATAQDQNGLAAVFLAIQLQGANFQPTRFEFDNGSTLIVTLANWQQFAAVWLPFRQSFFAVT
jgi:hypothetical protein